VLMVLGTSPTPSGLCVISMMNERSHGGVLRKARNA
jgi:hypothetical protein